MESFAQTLDARIFSTVVLFVIALASSLIAYKIGFFQISPQDKPSRKIPLKYLIYAILVFFAGPIVAGIIKWSFWQSLGFTDKGWLAIFSVTGNALAILAYLSFLPAEVRKTILAHGRAANLISNIKNFLFGMATWFVAYPIVVCLGQVLALGLYYFFGVEEADQSPVKVLRSTMENPTLFYFMVGSIAFIVPMIEELLFRGFLQTWLKNLGGRTFAILWASLIFASFHFSFEQGVTNIEFIAALFVLACFLGFIYERQKSIWAPIGLHSMFNLSSILIIFLDASK